MFHPISLVLPFLILLPNLFYFRSQPSHTPSENTVKENPILVVAEGIGRFGVFILPLFASIQIKSMYEVLAVTGMLICLVFYYVGWVRYFKGGRDEKLLYSPMLSVPMPLVVSPIVYFLLSSVILHSPYMFICSVILAIGHLFNSLKNSKSI